MTELKKSGPRVKMILEKSVKKKHLGELTVGRFFRFPSTQVVHQVVSGDGDGNIAHTRVHDGVLYLVGPAQLEYEVIPVAGTFYWGDYTDDQMPQSLGIPKPGHVEKVEIIRKVASKMAMLDKLEIGDFFRFPNEEVPLQLIKRDPITQDFRYVLIPYGLIHSCALPQKVVCAEATFHWRDCTEEGTE